MSHICKNLNKLIVIELSLVEKILDPYRLFDNSYFEKYFSSNKFYDHLLTDQYIITRTNDAEDLRMLINVIDRCEKNILALSLTHYYGDSFKCNEKCLISSCMHNNVGLEEKIYSNRRNII